ncbi:MAG: nuclear transport factor 2 family protein [Sphingobacteriales bacterium JAD_PAG50586_3]|nr:MAG: nuclear transport factor 2 family protein [Sphingobacteriales bacterium JAD_PAG50586_3]
MKLPEIIAELVSAQNAHNSTAFTNCFSPSAIVFDEGKKHIGTSEIKLWNEKTNKEYNTTLEPLGYEEKETESILLVNVSGSFDGSPIALHYHLTFENGLVQTLKITG